MSCFFLKNVGVLRGELLSKVSVCLDKRLINSTFVREGKIRFYVKR